ncbi:hypothetical protein, partial [Maribellus sediminis]|uniref:hypothetical protein n=1 Tax=Maribellus sediminis TaxID=2696285 RepID=UPI001431031C
MKTTLPKRNLTRALFLGLVFLIFGLYESYGQSLCPDGNCVSGDIVVLGGELVDENGIPLSSSTCTAGTTRPVFVKVDLDVTSSERYGFRMIGTMLIDGQPKSFDREICETLSSGVHSYVISLNSVELYTGGPVTLTDPFNWECGTSIQFVELLTIWSQNKPKNNVYEVCEYDPNDASFCSDITPKCKIYGAGEEIIITTPLSVALDWEPECVIGNSVSRIKAWATPSGGDGNYTINWNYIGGVLDMTSSNGDTIWVSYPDSIEGDTPNISVSVTDGIDNIAYENTNVILEHCCVLTINDASDQNTECTGSDPDLNAEYQAWLISNGGASATDSCSNVSWSFSGTTWVTSGCEKSISGYFTADDGITTVNSSTVTFTITDTKAPSIDVAAQDTTTECDGAGNSDQLTAWLVNNGGASASDVCGDVSWTNNFQKLTLSDECGETGAVLVTFYATDNCGNVDSTSATFTITDTQAPSIAVTAKDTTTECDGAGNSDQLTAWLVNNGGASASDVCGDVSWTNNFQELTLSDECGETGAVLVTFYATDNCGNVDSTSAT